MSRDELIEKLDNERRMLKHGEQTADEYLARIECMFDGDVAFALGGSPPSPLDKPLTLDDWFGPVQEPR